MTGPGPRAAPGDLAAVRLADPGLLFDLRAARLRALAEGHAVRPRTSSEPRSGAREGASEWLSLLAQIAHGQAVAVREIRAPRPATPPGGPPLAVDRLPRDDAWRRMLGVVLSQLRTHGLPVETHDAVRRLADSGVRQLEALADGLLAGAFPEGSAGCAPFLGAALQAWLAALAADLDPATLHPAQECPVCGGPPVAGIVQGDDRLRYVTCSLCTAEWNVPRVRCVSCDTATGPEYFHIEGHPGAKAEACPTCRSYLKLFDRLERPGADPAADDAATLALDLMLGEEGWHRAGANVYVGVG